MMAATPAAAQQEGEEEFRSVDPAVAGKAFKKLRHVLADAAAVAPDRLANELYSDSIISRATLRLVLEDSPGSIVKMLDEVEAWLERDGRHFSRLLTVFKNSSALTIDFAPRLVNNYRESLSMASPRGAGRVSTIKLAVCGLTQASLLTNRQTGQGAGKSFLCNKFMRPNFDDLSKNGHTSVLNHSEFGTNVINNTHFLYWGEKLVGLDDGQAVRFQIIEHTEFVDDSTLDPFPSNKPYHKRCTQIKLQSGGKVTYIEPDQLVLPENYKNVGRFPDKFIVDGYILCVDVSADFSVSYHGEFFERLLKNLGETKKPIVIALTKYDRVNEAALSTVSEVVSRSKRHHQLRLIEVSAEKGVNVDLCFLVLAHLVDTTMPKTRIISYADAKAHLDERIRTNEEQFQEVLDKNLTDFSMRVEDASTQLSGAIEHLLLTELCGKQRVKRLIRAKLNYLHHAKVEATQAMYMYLEHLPLILQTLLRDLPLDSTEKSALELLRSQVKFPKYFLDVENWREDAQFLKRADEVVPYSFLVENTEILQKFIDTTLVPAREEAAYVKIQQAIQKATGVIPGIDLQQLWEDLKVSEDVKMISPERLVRIYMEYMQVLDQECSAGLMELFLERLDLFGTVDATTDISDILSRVERGLADAPRYSRMERRPDIRRAQAIKFIASLQMPDKSVTFGKSHLLDSLPHAFMSKQRLTPPQWLPREGDLQWVLDPKDRCFNLAILASSENNALTLCSDFMNHLSGQGVCEVGGRSYQLEIDLFHGGEIPSLTKSEFTPQGAVAVVTSMECLDWLEELLSRLFVPGEDERPPYRGMPLVILALDRAEDSPIYERARCVADRVQAVFVAESPTPQPKRLVITTVIHQVLQLLIDCVTHVHGFLTNQLAVDDDGLNVAVCTLAGDPYSNESFLAPWQRHQLLSYDVTNHVLFLRTSFDKQNRICALRFFSSLNPREMSASIWLGYVLVYSTQRAASLSVLKALLPTLPSLPKLVVAMASEGSHDKQLLEEGRVLADKWKTMFISSSDEAFTVGYANEFLRKCWFSRFTSWGSQEMPEETKLRLTRKRKDDIQTTPLPSLPPGTRHSTALDIDLNHPPPPSSLPPLLDTIVNKPAEPQPQATTPDEPLYSTNIRTPTGEVEEHHAESEFDGESDTQNEAIQDEFEAAAREEAARDGFIRIRSQNILITGAGGAGKTCTMSVMFGEKPPDEYTSTGVCENARRAACVSGLPKQLVRDVESANRILFCDGKFTWLAGDRLLHLIARGAKACLPEIQEKRNASAAAVESSSELPESSVRDVSGVTPPSRLPNDAPILILSETKTVDSRSNTVPSSLPDISPAQTLSNAEHAVGNALDSDTSDHNFASDLHSESPHEEISATEPVDSVANALPSDSSNQSSEATTSATLPVDSTGSALPSHSQVSDNCANLLPSQPLDATALDEFEDHKLAAQVLANVAELMKDPSSEPLAEVDILHIVDSGGQLQFHEMLKKFVIPLHASIFVTDITANENSRVKDLFFKDGKPVGKPYESHYTHEQLFKRSLQALQLQAKSGKLAVVATHIDKIDEDKKQGAIEMKDRWISTVLTEAGIDGSKIIYRGDTLSGIVFALQAHNPLQPDKEMAQKLLTHLRSDVRVKPVDIPLRRFLLEQTLREAGKKSRGVVTMRECHKIARYFSIESVDDALQYLSNLNLILYVPEVIDDIVFCEVQTPLSALKQLVQYCAKVRADSEVINAPSADIDPAKLSLLATHGTLTEENLAREEFRNQFHLNFTPSKFLKLMEHFEIIAKKSTRPCVEYSMPCILREIPEDDLKIYRMPNGVNVEPLVLYFGNWPQAGVFCTLVTRLLSKYGWQPIPFKASDATVECLYRNCIRFEVNADRSLCCDVTLIESYDSGYFEVHINLPEGESPDSYKTLCPQVRQMLLDASPSDVQPKDALICSIPTCKDPKRHAAVFHADGLLRCTKGASKMRIRSDDSRYISCCPMGSEINQRETEKNPYDMEEASLWESIVPSGISTEDVPALLNLLCDLAGSWQLFMGQLGVPKGKVDHTACSS